MFQKIKDFLEEPRVVDWILTHGLSVIIILALSGIVLWQVNVK